MNTEQTAQQLELAAQILRTGHPYEFCERMGRWTKYDGDVMSHVQHGDLIRPILATPPDGRPLHNPDNLTAEQVGVGYRLMLKNEQFTLPVEYWNTSRLKWERSALDTGDELPIKTTYRLPLSVPWPEAKPDPYADEKKTVPLGPEDVKPFTVIRRKGEAQTWHWRTVSYVDAVKVTCGNRGYGWAELASDYERNESLTTGKWNPDAWRPCSKQIDA